MPALAQIARVVRYDARGFGRSTRDAGTSYCTPAISGFCSTISGSRKAVLVGMSMGGRTARRGDAGRSRAGARLVLLDALLDGVPWDPESKRGMQAIREPLQAGDLAGAKAAWFHHGFFGPARRDPDVVRRLAEMLDDYSGVNWTSPDPHEPHPDSIELLGTISAPTTVVIAELDVPCFRDMSGVLAERIPSARKVTVPGVGHMVEHGGAGGSQRAAARGGLESWPFADGSCKLRRHEPSGPGGSVASSGIEPHGTTAENVDDTVRRLVVERSHDLVVLCDLKGAIVYASPSWLSIGWDPRELAGVAIRELVHPDDLGVSAAVGEKLNAGANVDGVTVRLRGPDGAYTWFEINGSQVLGEDGELRFTLGTARDVSEREELRSRLRDLDAVYRFADAVAGRASSARCSRSRSTRCSRRRAPTAPPSSSATRRTSCASARGAGCPTSTGPRRTGTPRGLPDEKDPQPVLVEEVAAAGFEPWLEEIVRNEGIAALAFVPLVRRGRLLGKFMLYRNAPHAWSDREILLARTIANHLASVTERTRRSSDLHESREQLATILRAVDEGITVADTAGRLLYANDASARQLGRHVRRGAPRRAARGVARAVRAPRRRRRDRSRSTCCRPARRCSVRRAQAVVRIGPARPATERWLDVRANPVFGPDGAVELVVNVSRDITQSGSPSNAGCTGEEGSRARLALLREATEILVGTLGCEERLRRVPQLAVPRIAAGYLVYLARNDETDLVRVAHAHVDPSVAARVDRIDAVYQVSATVAFRPSRSSAPGSRCTMSRSIARSNGSRGRVEDVVRMDSRSLIVVPLEAGGRRLGALAVSTMEPGSLGGEDCEMVSELARRISLALDLVDLHRRAQDSLAQLQAVIAQLPLGVAITDAEHRLVLKNEELERVWGGAVQLGSDHRKSTVKTAGWPLERAVDSGEVTVGERREIEREDGTRTLEISAAPVRDADGAIVSAVAVVGDVTRRSRSEEQLRFLAQRERAPRREPRLGGDGRRDCIDRGAGARRLPRRSTFSTTTTTSTRSSPRTPIPEMTELVDELRGRYPPTFAHPPGPDRDPHRRDAADPRPPGRVSDEMAHDAEHVAHPSHREHVGDRRAARRAWPDARGAQPRHDRAGQRRFDESDCEMATELARRHLPRARQRPALRGGAGACARSRGARVRRRRRLPRRRGSASSGSGTRPRRSACGGLPAEAVGRPIAELLADWPSLERAFSRRPPAAGGVRARRRRCPSRWTGRSGGSRSRASASPAARSTRSAT